MTVLIHAVHIYSMLAIYRSMPLISFAATLYCMVRVDIYELMIIKRSDRMYIGPTKCLVLMGEVIYFAAQSQLLSCFYSEMIVSHLADNVLCPN